MQDIIPGRLGSRPVKYARKTGSIRNIQIMDPFFPVPGDHIPHLVGDAPVNDIQFIFTVGLLQHRSQRTSEQSKVRFLHIDKNRKERRSCVFFQIKRRPEDRGGDLPLPQALGDIFLHQKDILRRLLIGIRLFSVSGSRAHGSSTDLFRALCSR